MAENSGGAHCFKYGFTTNYVTGLEVVLPTASSSRLGGHELDPPGYDLVGAFVGSEGTLGVATRVTLRVVPVPETIRTLVAFFGHDGRGGRRRCTEIVAAGIVPGRDRDDGPAGDPAMSGHARRLPARCGRGADR